MVNCRLMISMAALPVVLLASPAAAVDTYLGPGPSICMATASFAGSTVSIHLNVDRSGNPANESRVVYSPKGSHDGLSITVAYPLKADRSVDAPFSLLARAIVTQREAGGSFVLTVGEQKFRSVPMGTVFSGDPRYHGKVEVTQSFEMKAPLIDALAKGGPARLAYLDSKRNAGADADLSFAPKASIQGAVEKAYPTALKLAAAKGQC